ncbi:hypothetical protein ACFYTQ_07050 [Nocardia sp. NPDC004068]|uniref:hypothetical protein n=1 Tax=Nocardia sp. NPDC004068 TaxID=3364303 RepID=UPI00368821B7
MQQGPAVLGLDGLREIDERQVLPLIRGQLELIAEHGHLRTELSIPMTARIVYSLLLSAAGAISQHDDPATATAQAWQVVDRMVDGLFVPAAAAESPR